MNLLLNIFRRNNEFDFIQNINSYSGLSLNYLNPIKKNFIDLPRKEYLFLSSHMDLCRSLEWNSLTNDPPSAFLDRGEITLIP